MSIEGRIAVDVGFADKADGTAVQSLKKLTLADTTSYTTGKVAIITGTCGTAAVTVNFAPTTYSDASGSAVSFATVSRVAFAARASNSSKVRCEDWEGDMAIYSAGGRVAVSEADINPAQSNLLVRTTGTSGTATYTLVLYGT